MKDTIGYKQSFTMAEILISLTIIGIIAAITLPSLVGNINEKTWSSQRKALYSRMTQALSMLPSLNGYGATGEQAETNEKAALAFVSDGLSKVLQINNICDSTKLKDCGLPEKITTLKNTKTNFPTNLTELNPLFTQVSGGFQNPQYYINTNSAGFETKNGESVAVFYNPLCRSEIFETSKTYYVEPFMCANFIYDLNGKKGPNKMGKDIGFITALYPTDSVVVAPILHQKYAVSSYTYNVISHACKNLDNSTRLPNLEELFSIFITTNC